jgi:gentisate 1,2-dioxygenase
VPIAGRGDTIGPGEDHMTPELAGSSLARRLGEAATHEDSAVEEELATFYADLADANLHPLWQITKQLLPPTPRPRAVPWLWSSRTLIPLAERALRLVPVDRGGERRVLSLGNPGMPGSPYAAGTLWAAIQCLGPGETAPAHRHTPGAIRFVLEGTGVSTTVDGDACDMTPGDLLLTPAWGWHDHTSTGEARMLWFDGLDLPMIEALDAVFFEPYPDFRQPVPDAHNLSERRAPAGARFATGAVSDTLDPRPSPLLIYRWADTDVELSRLADEAGRPPGLVSLEFVNPATGASVLPTLSCGMHRLAAGGSSDARRCTGNTVFVVYRGAGHSVVDGTRFDWEAGDMLVVPSWAAAEHHSPGAGADLFSLSDAPVLRALGIYREARLDDHQDVVGNFVGGEPS